MTASNSTSIIASWQLPPADSRNGIIAGFKLFFKKRGSAGLPATLTMNNGQIGFKHVTGLDKYSEYEFQVLAFTSIGDGPRSAVTIERTMEDGSFFPLVYWIKKFVNIEYNLNIPQNCIGIIGRILFYLLNLSSVSTL